MKNRRLKIFGILILIAAVMTCSSIAYADDDITEMSAEEAAVDESQSPEDEIAEVMDITDISAEQASPSEVDSEETDIEYIENDLVEAASPSEADKDGEDVAIEFKDGETIILPELERDGYFFVEWNTKEDGSGESFHAGDEYKVKTDGNLYAIWKKADDTQDENQVKEAETEETPADSLKTDIVQAEQPTGSEPAEEMKREEDAPEDATAYTVVDTSPEKAKEPEEESSEPAANLFEESSAESVTMNEAVPFGEVIEEGPSEPEGNEM